MLHHFELRAAAVEVVVFAVDAEILVAVEVVGEEADAALEGHELGGKGQVVHFRGGEEIPRRGQVAVGQPVEQLQADADAGQVALVLRGGAGADPDRVAEVVSITNALARRPVLSTGFGEGGKGGPGGGLA